MKSAPSSERWRLPDGVDELQPAAVRRVERLRHAFFELGERWGFAPVSPPLIESLDGLLTGTAEVLQRDTFQIVDQTDGRTLGVRADMTPQVARMDAQSVGGTVPNRLLYTGTVLRTRADGIGASRNPQQFGAELFGHPGTDSDIEVVRLMLETILLAGIPTRSLVLDLGHVGVYAGLVTAADFDDDTRAAVFDAMVRGSVPDARQAINADPVTDASAERARAALLALPTLRGAVDVLEPLRARCGGIHPRVDDALVRMERVSGALKATHPEVGVHIDLCELRGFRYHNGLLFAVHDNRGQQLARGGRYDAVGEAFGSARAATGFSGDLKRLSELSPESADNVVPRQLVGVAAADLEQAGAWNAVCTLRASGQAVVTLLPDADLPEGVTSRLVRNGADWTTLPIDGA